MIALLARDLSPAIWLARVGCRERALLGAQEVVRTSQLETPRSRRRGRQSAIALQQRQSRQMSPPGLSRLPSRGAYPPQFIVDLRQCQFGDGFCRRAGAPSLV